MKEKLFKYSLLVVFSILFVAPLLFALVVSVTPNVDFLNGDISLSRMTLENFALAFQKANILRFALNSFLLSILIVSVQLIFASLAAYAFVFVEFKGREMWFSLFLGTMMIPFEATFVSNFSTIKNLGLMDTFLGLGLPFFASAFATFFLRQTFKQIPYELFEASLMSGLTHAQFYKRIVMPMSKSSLLTLGIYTFLTSWNMYLWPLLTSTNNRVRTVQIGLRQLQSEETLTNWGVIMAGALIIALPTLLILYFTQNRLQEGLAEGAIK